FFMRAVDFGRNPEAVPVNELGLGGFVGDVDGDGLAFGETKQRSGDSAVVGQRFDHTLGSELEVDRFDAEANIGLGSRSGYSCASKRKHLASGKQAKEGSMRGTVWESGVRS